MAHPRGSREVKVGVRLARRPDDIAEWLADAAAFEAAGADALWVDLAPEPPLDPFAVIAALAAVTSRSILVAVVPASEGPPEAFARTLTTIELLSRGRLRVLAGASQLGRLAEVSPHLRLFRGMPGSPEAFQQVSEARAGDGDGDGDGPPETERWVATGIPDGRAGWRAALLDAAERGFHGVVVPVDPRLLDILRNPDDPGDRLDLQLAMG